jgi:hypothetical protein
MTTTDETRSRPKVKTRLLRAFLIGIVLLDFILVCLLSFRSLTQHTTTQIESENNGTISSSMTHNGLRIDIDADQVLHIASRHQGWWQWGSALYHHFKSPNSEWKTEEIRWKKTGLANYDVFRQYLVLRQLTQDDKTLSAINSQAKGAIMNLVYQKMTEYRGDAGDAINNKCWNPKGNTVDCVVQELPLLFVSPKNELYVFNARRDDKNLYFQKIAPTDYWSINSLANSEIDSIRGEKELHSFWIPTYLLS